MCGIVSIFQPGGGVDEAPLRRALDTLRHRGPDGEGVWLSPDRCAGLGHVRLAVLDLPGSGQPILSEDGQICLIVNGEFYGFEALRRKLEQHGHRFRTAGDSEIALHLYEDLGVDVLHHLRGEFALVLWDGHRRRLLAARDRFGIKPLCYHEGRDGLAIASEAKALFALGVRRAWDHETFFQVAGVQYPPPDRTLFAGVRQLRPGHYLLADDHGPRTATYWDLDYPRDSDVLPDNDVAGLAGELRWRIDEAVRVRLRADVPVGFHLSGGIDSSAVVSLAARHLAAPPVCFTVGFEGAGYDELDLAQHTAAWLGATLHPVPVTQEDLVGHLADAVYFSEGLAINGHLTAKYLLARAIREAGCKVIVSGEGSDEILAGYAHLRRDLLLADGPAAADRLADLSDANAIMAGIQLPEGEALPLDAVHRALGFVPSFLEAKATLGFRMRAVLDRDFRAAFAGRDPFEHFLECFDVPAQLAGRHWVDQASYLWTRSALANYILRTLGDGTEMAHAVEGRLPFLDHELFAFARRLPVGLKIRDGVEKYVLREALAGLLPEAVRRRRKQPFTAPPLSRFSTTVLDGFMRDTFQSRACAALGFLDRDQLLNLLDRLPQLADRERVALDPVLMLALTACLLQERFAL
jgi:asparagine synthase (glutamine-hydrolysing)